MPSQAQSTCPVCDAPASPVMDVPGARVREQVSGLFDAAIPDCVELIDYKMRACEGCQLVFADPMQPGSGDYYGWITAQAKYHAGARWEWRVIRDDFAAAGPLRVLEVGCGDGKLMDFLKHLSNVSMVGVDVSAPSIDKARAQGFDVHLAAFEALGDVLQAVDPFDVVVLSHVMEHVGDPLGVMRQVASLLKPGGRIYTAVPYSPMSRELAGWDIQNLPPHHLTRWNQSALAKLATMLGMGVDLRLPKAKSALKRAVQETCGEVLDNKHPSVPVRAWTVLSHLSTFTKWHTQFKARERVNGRPAGDSVLARFSKD